VHMQMGGTGTNQYDRVAVAGAAQLAGTLNVTFTNGFFPVLGTTFTAMTYTASSGKFDRILTPNYEFAVEYRPTALILRASNSLPRVLVSAPSTQVVCQPFRLSASATDLDGRVTNITFLQDGVMIGSFPSGEASMQIDYDFPRSVTFAAEAQANVSFVTLPLHVLTLGGFVDTNGFFKICMLGELGSNYMMQAATELLGFEVVTNWTDLSLMESTNGIFRLSDPVNRSNRPVWFYRARQVP
jgi:hypothetical protein